VSTAEPAATPCPGGCGGHTPADGSYRQCRCPGGDPTRGPGYRAPEAPLPVALYWEPLADAFAARVAELDLYLDEIERDERRPLDAYPAFPPGTCRWAARALAAAYPELVAVVGELVVVYRVDGTVWRLPHAWNLRADGAIVDATFPTLPFSPRVAAVVYVPGGEWPSDDREADR
jgi:hypothetical protein